MNRLTIIGNLTADPELRYVNTAGGQQTACNFTVAVNRMMGHDKKVTDYFRVSCWNRQADNAAKYLAKGSKVAVVGPVTARPYKSRDGEPRASLEMSAEFIEYLNSRPAEPDNYQNTGAQAAPHPQQAQPPQYQAQQQNIDGFMQIPDGIDEELPFS